MAAFGVASREYLRAGLLFLATAVSLDLCQFVQSLHFLCMLSVKRPPEQNTFYLITTLVP
jgi:hypothetical protein